MESDGERRCGAVCFSISEAYRLRIPRRVRAAGRGRWRPGEINWRRSPDQLRDIRGGVRVVPDVAALIRAPRKCRCCYQRMISKTVSTPFARRRPDPSRESSARSSLTWRVDREAAIFLGAGRALLLQLAHPWVAAAISEHSRTFADPVGRFHRTFNITFTMVFGTLDQALAASRRLHRRHAAVTGILPQAAGRYRGRFGLQRQRGLGAALGSRHAGGDRLADA